MRFFLIIFIVIVVVLGGVFVVLCELLNLCDDFIVKYGGFEVMFIEFESGGEVYYRDEGLLEGFLLVFIYGLNVLLYIWELWVSELEEDFCVVFMDLLVYGLMGVVLGGVYDIDYMVMFVKEVVDELGFG